MSVRINVQSKYSKSLVKEFKRIDERLGWGLKKVALAEMQGVMDESLQEVPRGTGALAASAFITQDRRGNVSFGYGGKNVQENEKTKRMTDEYMLAVHERTDYKHSNGKAKFLEDPLNRYVPEAETKIAAKLKKFFHF